MKWISIKDELPEKDGEYLVYIEKDIHIASVKIRKHYRKLYYEWEYPDIDQGNYPICETPTHWMPLPKPPEK